MKIVERGYIYELESFEGMGNQRLRFISKDGERIVLDGTTNEELLEVLIDRLLVMQEKSPSRENEIVLQKLEEGLMWLQKKASV